MFTTISLKLYTPTLLELIQHLQKQNCTQDVSEAIQCAIDAWLQAGAAPAGSNDQVENPVASPVADHVFEPGSGPASGHASTPASGPACGDASGDVKLVRGYQWKSLFLPEGTVLRSWSYGEHNYARVQGDHIVHRGSPVTPNQFARLFARTTRNAWRDLYIRRPGDPSYTLACRLRDLLAAQPCHLAQPPQPPQLPPPALPPAAAAAPVPQPAQPTIAALLTTALSALLAGIGAVPLSAPPTPTPMPAAAPARDTPPGEGWTLPERRTKRFRLEDVAFE